MFLTKKHQKKCCYSIIIFLILLGFLFGCQNQMEFESEKWKYRYDISYPNRPKMIKSITESKILENKSLNEVENLLGVPNWIDTTQNGYLKLIYQVQESYGWDIDPLYTSILIIELDTITEKVKNINFHESEDRRTWLEKITTE